MYIEAARPGKHTPLSYVLSFLTILFAMFFLSTIVVLAILGIHNALRPDGEFGVGVNPDNLGEKLYLIVLLVPFVLWFFTQLGVVKWLHQRTIRSLFTARGRIDWSRIGLAFAVWFFLSLGMDAISYWSDPGNYVFQFDLERFIPMFIIAVLLFPIQTSAEELFFRGYLLQSVGLLAKYRWISLVFTSALFAAMHGLNPEVSAYGTGYMMSYYFGVGVTLAVITIMDDGLELALGYHAANNLYGALIVSPPDSAIETSSVFAMQSADKFWMMAAWVFGAIAFVAFCWNYYEWGSAEKLVQAIEEEPMSGSSDDQAAADPLL
ncbi:MAG: type II CAAX endopeptidase family protein [Calditrichota bacterium]